MSSVSGDRQNELKDYNMALLGLDPKSPEVSSKETYTHLDGGGGLSIPEDGDSRLVSTTHSESHTFSVTHEEVCQGLSDL